MASYLNPHGVEVSAADAKIGGKLRPGFKEILADGERISFDMLFMRDAKPKADETSIDAALREVIATLAKNQNITPAEYLAKTPLADIQKLAAEAAAKVLESLSGKGVASKLADQRHRETMDVLRKGRFMGHDKFIEAADSDTPARPTIPSGMTQTDAIAYLRKARYS